MTSQSTFIENSAFSDGGPSIFGATGWTKLDWAQRKSLATGLHKLWKSGVPLNKLSFFEAGQLALGAQYQPQNLYPSGKPISQDEIMHTLADWRLETRSWMPARSALRFFTSFLSPEPVDHPTRYELAKLIQQRVDSRSRQRARTLYKNYLFDGQSKMGAIRGFWLGDPTIEPATLLMEIQAIEQDGATEIIKNQDRNCVMRASLFGEDALIKRYDLKSTIEKLKYRFRVSRARRAWAASRTLNALEIRTPRPLGVLEVFEHGIPVRSYVINQFMDGTCNVNDWMVNHYLNLNPEDRTSFRKELLGSLLSLYEAGLYHKDTKSFNILVPDKPADHTFFWIDLECLQPGVELTPHRLVRNLVQLNGCLDLRIPEEDRCLFLKEVSAYYPWVTRPKTVQKIRQWTARRLNRNVPL